MVGTSSSSSSSGGRWNDDDDDDVAVEELRTWQGPTIGRGPPRFARVLRETPGSDAAKLSAAVVGP